MVDELNLIKETKINSYEVRCKEVQSIYEMLDLSLSIDKIMIVTESLSRKANEILAATPPAFRISEHFLNALRESK
jgi:hypothetical protein